MKLINNLIGQQFNRLVVLERAANPKTRKNDTAAYWKCRCSCGKIVIIRGYSLTSGKTQSCGCLKAEAAHLKPYAVPKYSAEIAAAHDVWQGRYIELNFEDFYRLSQMPCHYCQSPPSLMKKTRQIKSNVNFIFNTLDRLNSAKTHALDNVVACCLICNRAKLQRTVAEFTNYLTNLVKIKKLSFEQYREKTQLIDASILNNREEYSLITSIKATASFYTDGNLTLTQFYQLAVSNCYYCGQVPVNKRNICNNKSSKYAKEKGNFIYNGLDRINNNLNHDYDNVISCCKWCNSAKGNLSIEQFYAWIDGLRGRVVSKSCSRLPPCWSKS